jgi:hypothetical protein
MSENRTAFLEYIEEVAVELFTAHAETNQQFDLKNCISNLNQLAKLIQQCPARINLRRTKNLLSLGNGLYEDLIQPALLKRLASPIK